MPPQHIEIAETIIALKRALRREKEAPSDQRISSATNRGNKLKQGANYVHAGSLPYRYGSHGYKERIEHAGYQRYVLDRNPKKYNEYGDELNESESDADADADADDVNPYGDVRLEELLRPLTHPAELATHPTLSIPFLDSSLPEIVKSTEEQLRQERANLWRAKNLHRQFIGDESWMPCGSVEVLDDWDLFEPLQEKTTSSSSRKRKREGGRKMIENGVNGQDHAKSDNSIDEPDDGISTGLANGIVQGDGQQHEHIKQETALENGNHVDSNQEESTAVNGTDDVSMLENDSTQNNNVNGETDPSDTHADAEKGTTGEDTRIDSQKEDDGPDPMPQVVEKTGFDGATATGSTGEEEAGKNNKDDDDNDHEEEVETPPPQPPRRITRALAAAEGGAGGTLSKASTPPLSPTMSTLSTMSSNLLQPAPIFLLPTSLTLSHTPHPTTHLPLHVAHSGLPLDEILETRRLLGMYIQKQEETIRGLEGVLGKLIKAKRMKDRVWEWCKAEGHIGEWSDGEDWVDTDAWEIRADELRKGRDEEEQEVQEESRKGKRRRGGRE